MASEIVVTVGADTTQLQQGLNQVSNLGSQAGQKSTSWASMLGKAFGYFTMIKDAVGDIVDKFMEIANKARELRNLSIATGISTSELQRYEILAKNAGISLTTFAHSISEFNKKMGEAKIRGSEANAALTKLGFGLRDIESGNLTYKDTLIEMAKAYEAGTDEATLMHYGIQLFGSSFEQLLPIIKQGTVDIQKRMEALDPSNEKYVSAAAAAADTADRLATRLERALLAIAGSLALAGEDVLDETDSFLNRMWLTLRHMAGASNRDLARDYADAIVKQMTPGKTKAQQKEYIDYYRENLDDESKKYFDERIKEIYDTKGKKLTPLGLSEAQGASTLQQMGGGDIISAIAFTPLERIATATEETARNTAPKAEGDTTHADVPLELR